MATRAVARMYTESDPAGKVLMTWFVNGTLTTQAIDIANYGSALDQVKALATVLPGQITEVVITVTTDG